MGKNWIYIGALLGLLAGCNPAKKTENKQVTRDTTTLVSPQEKQEEHPLSKVITAFAQAYALKDNAKANALIHPDLGLYIIYRPGAGDTFVQVDRLDFSKPVPSVYAYTDLTIADSLQYASLPHFDCGTEKWDKVGFYCDTTTHPNQLSTIAAFEKEFEEDKFSEDALINLEKAEKESYRVILTANAPLIFHVRKYRGQWYVTALDRAYGGCDA